METVRKTYKYKLKPTPEQERELERSCGAVAGSTTRRWSSASALRQRGVSVSRYAQEAELKDLRAAMPEYAAIHSHVLQDVLARLDKTYQAFFRASAGGRRQAFRAFRARGRFNSFTYKEYRQRRDAG